MDERTKSYRVSRIDAAPEAAIPSLQVAYDAVREQREPLQDILQCLNRAVREAGCEPFSASGFYRYAKRVRLGTVVRPTMAVDRLSRGRSAKLELAQRAVQACGSEFGPSVSNARLLTAMLDAVIVEAGLDAVRRYVGQEQGLGALLEAS